MEVDRKLSGRLPDSTGGSPVPPGTIERLDVFGSAYAADAFAEESGSDAHQGGALFDSHFEIAAHTHAQVRQRGTQFLLAVGFDLAEPLEIGSRFLRQGRVGRDSH